MRVDFLLLGVLGLVACRGVGERDGCRGTGGEEGVGKEEGPLCGQRKKKTLANGSCGRGL